MAIGSQIIKERYRFTDEIKVEHIAMNPYLQYFMGHTKYRQAATFDPSMMSRFRQRLTPEMMQDGNDVIIGRKTAELIADKVDKHDDDSGDDSSGGGDDFCQKPNEEMPNEGTLILDATCARQAIRFPTDTSLLSKARQNTEGIIGAFHVAGLTDGKKPRTYRFAAKKQYNSFPRAVR